MSQVKYMKALYGFGGEPIISGQERTAASWKKMVQDIGDRPDDWLAVYIPSKSGERDYHFRIGAFLQIGALGGKSIYDYGRDSREYDWNEQRWGVAVPAKNWLRVPIGQAPELKSLMSAAGKSSDWNSMKASLRGGPINLQKKYPYLVPALSQLFDSIRIRLIPIKERQSNDQ